MPPFDRYLMMHLLEELECEEFDTKDLEKYTKLLPKRLKGPQDLGEPKGWGLQAVHRPFVGLIIFVVLAPSLLFFALWLRWHPGDVGNASGPPALAVAFLAFVLALMAHSNATKPAQK